MDGHLDRAGLASLAACERPPGPEQCAELARRAATYIELAALDRSGPGSFLLLWRNEHSEAWLNTWWQPRDTGYHDHEGSCVGVHVLEGRASNEGFPVGGPRRVKRYGAGQSFWLAGTGIHRMDHDAGAVTIHVYAPPIRALGHYEIIDGELHRIPGPPDGPSQASTSLLNALDATS